ncbi:MAG TPA: rod shape-determining protein MreC, partial [Actinomycetota bacterium]|nr:rod shape-determining protein MreC [Actinomycetota bacterium]
MALRNRARSTRVLVVTLVSVSLITITVDYREGDSGPLAAAGDAALTVISPLQEAVSTVTDPIGNFFSTLVRLPSIRRENTELREEVEALRQQVSTTQADLSRLAQLEDLLGLQQSLGPKAETTAAQVIASGPSNFEWTITIDEGSGAGVEPGMPVVASAG